MAVSFKVPASPKRNIFEVNDFLGVDLTNSGVDMDERRSPHAENMVRYVPGKVRKRTGYKKSIYFGPIGNVNFAIGTSAVEKKIEITEDHIDEDIELYKIKTPPAWQYSGGFWTEFDYKASEDFTMGPMDGGGEIIPASDEWTHYSGSIAFSHYVGYDYIILDYVAIQSHNPQTISIKKFELTFDRYFDPPYEWHPCPEYYVKRDDEKPIYGCHVAKKHSDFEGNRVLNVNRVLDSHDYAESILVPAEDDAYIKNVGEASCGKRVYIEYDYRVTPYYSQHWEPEWYIKFTDQKLYASDEWEHIEIEWEIDDYQVKAINDFNYAAYLEIKNFSVVYEKDEDFEWSPAPEDNGDTFHKEDVFYIGSKNYAISDGIDDTVTVGNVSYKDVYYDIMDSEESDLYGYSHISFDISTSTTKTISEVSLGVGNVDQGFSKDYEGNINREHIEIFYAAGEDYFDPIPNISIRFTKDDGNINGKCRVMITNLTVNKITPRDVYYVSSKWYIYHVGKDFYLRANNDGNFVKVFSDANEHISRSWQLKDKLYIIDGKNLYMHDVGKGSIEIVGQDNAYIPTLTIAKENTGGGTAYESLNLIQPGFYELFQGKASVTQYQLTFGNLDPTECKAWVLNQNGGWDVKVEDTDFTVNRSTGKITFTTAPGVSPITGEDNIKILAYRTVKDYKDRIVKCTLGTLYGVGGAGDRLFLSGNPDHPNWDFYSQQFDPTYFPDTSYSTLGSEQSAITGYAIVNNYLTTFKDGFDTSQSVFVREGDLLKKEEDEETTEAVFKLINTLQGEGVISPYSFGYIQTEPLFLTKAGIYAITEQDITGEKYSQNRSFYLDGQLTQETGLESAMATVYDNQYILALNNQLYILDGLQATRTDKSEPYATRQYAAFHCTDVPACCLWNDEGVWFGTADGKVCSFNKDIESLSSYNDDGKPIYSCWETTDLSGRLFYKNKTFRYIAVRLMKAIKTSVKLYSRKLGVWTLNKDEAWTFIKEQNLIANALDFNDVDFEMFTFSVDTSEKVIHSKLRVKKVDKARFRIENEKINEPFGIMNLALEFIESGNYKG